LEKLPAEGQEVYSLEEGLDQNEIDSLAKAGYDFADAFCTHLNSECDWRDYADLRFVFAHILNRSFYATFYKGLLLQQQLYRLDGLDDPKVICVGAPDVVQPEGINLGYGRFDTLFAYIAAVCNRNDVQVFEHIVSADKCQKLHEAVVYRRLSPFEKLLSLINNTSSSFAYKAWRTLATKGLYPFKHVGVWTGAKSSFYIYKECELIDELFLSLLFRGARIGRIGPLPKPEESDGKNGVLPRFERLERLFRDLTEEHLAMNGLHFRPVYEACTQIVCHRLLTALGRLRSNLQQITRKFDSIASGMRTNGKILTNALSSPVERLFYCYCRAKDITVAAFEHGITMGLSKWSLYAARHTNMLAADIGAYHCNQAVRTITPYAPKQKTFVVGLPKTTRTVLLDGLQRHLARRWLGIRRKDHVVMYVADLERNNFIYGPFCENDLQFLKKTKDIVESILMGFPSSKIVLKLYPTARYLENYTFEELSRRHQRLIILKDIDFRFLRAAADMLFVTSSQSTLGWVLGTNKPCVFLEFSWSPALLQGFDLECPKIDGLARVQLLTNEYKNGYRQNRKRLLAALMNR
jgi:hypothetical protein